MNQDKESPELFYPGIGDKAKELHPEIFKAIDEAKDVIKQKKNHESKGEAIPEKLDIRLGELIAYLEGEELTVFNPAIGTLENKLKEVDEKQKREDYKQSIEVLRYIVHEIAKVRKGAHESFPHVKKDFDGDLSGIACE